MNAPHSKTAAGLARSLAGSLAISGNAAVAQVSGSQHQVPVLRSLVRRNPERPASAQVAVNGRAGLSNRWAATDFDFLNVVKLRWQHPICHRGASNSGDPRCKACTMRTIADLHSLGLAGLRSQRTNQALNSQYNKCSSDHGQNGLCVTVNHLPLLTRANNERHLAHAAK
jgi:hypothetical protein